MTSKAAREAAIENAARQVRQDKTGFLRRQRQAPQRPQRDDNTGD